MSMNVIVLICYVLTTDKLIVSMRLIVVVVPIGAYSARTPIISVSYVLLSRA